MLTSLRSIDKEVLSGLAGVVLGQNTDTEDDLRGRPQVGEEYPDHGDRGGRLDPQQVGRPPGAGPGVRGRLVDDVVHLPVTVRPAALHLVLHLRQQDVWFSGCIFGGFC